MLTASLSREPARTAAVDSQTKRAGLARAIVVAWRSAHGAPRRLPTTTSARCQTISWRCILDEPELHLGLDVIVPGIAGWRRDRMPRLPEEAFISPAPDWVCEVLSPSTAALDRVKKLAIYNREGVSYVWLVDPIAQTLEVLEASDGAWTLVSTAAGGSTVHAAPFEALPLDLTLLWDEPAPSEAR